MNSQEFAYWLQGYFEISGNQTLNEQQVQVIKEHLNLIFVKQTTTVINNGFSGGFSDFNKKICSNTNILTPSC